MYSRVAPQEATEEQRPEIESFIVALCAWVGFDNLVRGAAHAFSNAFDWHVRLAH
jgi:hypothetical protein